MRVGERHERERMREGSGRGGRRGAEKGSAARGRPARFVTAAYHAIVSATFCSPLHWASWARVNKTHPQAARAGGRVAADGGVRGSHFVLLFGGALSAV